MGPINTQMVQITRKPVKETDVFEKLFPHVYSVMA